MGNDHAQQSNQQGGQPHSSFRELSPGQAALWFLYEMDPRHRAYNTLFAWHVRSEINTDLFEKAISKLQERHEMWRSTFVVHDGKPKQMVHEQLALPFSLVAADNWDADRTLAAVKEELHEAFDLKTEAPIKWKLFHNPGGESAITLRMHHLAADMWSVMATLVELKAIYSGLLQDDVPELPPINLKMDDFLQWQSEKLAGKKGDRLRKFWKQELSGDLPLLNLPGDRAHPPVPTFDCEELPIELSAEQKARLAETAAKLGVSPFAFFIAAYQLFLFRYSNQSDILTGVPTLGRKGKFGGIFGYFVSPVVIRSAFTVGETFAELSKRVAQKVFLAIKNQDLPFPHVVNLLASDSRDASRSPVFQNSFSWESFNSFENIADPLVSLKENGREKWDLGALELERIPSVIQLDNFDLSIRIIDIDGQLQPYFRFNKDIFDQSTIERATKNFATLLCSIADNPDERIENLHIIAEDEKNLMLGTWNATDTSFDTENCPFRLFEQQVEKEPDKIALRFEHEEITYEELNRRANKVAHYLRDNGVKPDKLVGISMERCVDMIVAIVATHKAGGAYVPLDPQYPEERIHYIVEESKPPVILTLERLSGKLAYEETKIVCLDADWAHIEPCSDKNPEYTNNLNHLSHVIYTSGSTGKPKGVAIEHRSVSALVDWTERVYSSEETAGVLASTSINFDLSVYEIVATLALGGSIILVENALYLPGAPAADKVRLINTVPSAIKELIRTKGIPTNVVTINLAGEPLKNSVVQDLYRLKHVEKVYNCYGPSEDTTYSTWALMERGDDYTVLIGKPLYNTQAYVLDPQLNPVPIGVPGELYLGGIGLARGYLNRPDLTMDRFTPNPFDVCEGDRIYKTGDLIRFLPDGNMECLGRIDHQVKIRGFRIELGEIETALQKHPSVHESIVVDKEVRDEKVLAGYVTLKPDHKVKGQELRDYLGEHLPEYMVPTFMIVLDAMPLNPNGKIDRKKLPEPQLDAVDVGEVVKPRNELEQIITEVWREVLGIDNFGVNDKFFNLGGNSLLIAQVRFKLQEKLDHDVQTTDLFQYPTVSSLANFMASGDETLLAMSAPRISAGSGDNRIAVISMGLRVQDADEVEQFWENLCAGKESISRFSAADLRASKVDEEDIEDPDYVPARGILNDLSLFDATFFGISPREAQILDPQQRLFVEACWEVLEKAAYNSDRYDGRIGVFAGSALSSYFRNNLAGNRKLLRMVGEMTALWANDKDFLATRVAYYLNCKGPAYTVDHACSKSLGAIHVAAKNLISGECDMALAGGVTLVVPQKQGYMYAEGGTMSPDGCIRTFDSQAKGMVASNGLGVVLLKRLDDAVRDGDNIYAVLKGSAMNNDGSAKIGFTAPSIDGQMQCIFDAMQNAGVHPEDISYVEAHGTGTPLGDPIEIAAISKVYRQKTKEKQYCAIGSLKTNLGHLDSAAGVASFIKASLCLHHRKVPPSLNYKEPNPAIDFAASPFRVNTELSDLTRKENNPLHVAISAFGIGGTNVHAILEEAPEPQASEEAKPWQLLVLSAKTPSALEKLSSNMAVYLKENEDVNIADLAYTLQVGRRPLPFRRYLVCSDAQDAITALANLQPTKVISSKKEVKQRDVVFMFSGQGSQYLNMGRDLYENEPVFKEEMDRCNEILKPHLGFDLLELLYPQQTLSEEEYSEYRNRINQTSVTQPSLFCVEYATAKLLNTWGIHASSMIGHSIGEYVAAHLAGVFSLEDALRIVAVRGRLMQAQPAGSMLAVPLAEEALKPYLSDQVSLAALNSPGRSVVAGTFEAIDTFVQKLEEAEISSTRLHTSHAFHSYMMDPMLDEFIDEMKKTDLQPPKTPYVSNLSATWITDEEACDPSYYARHVRGTVRFELGMDTLLEQPEKLFVEVGPGKTLLTFANTKARSVPEASVIQTLRHPKKTNHDREIILKAIGQAWLEGNEVDWSGLHVDAYRRRLQVPTYPFERRRHWIEPVEPEEPVVAAAPAAAAPKKAKAVDPGRKQDLGEWFASPTWASSVPPNRVPLHQLPEHLQTWLVFKDRGVFADQLINRLQLENRRCVIVEIGKGFAELGEGRYQLQPDSEADYLSLFKALQEKGLMPETIAHFWSLSYRVPTGNQILFAEEMLARGMYSLFFIAKALDAIDYDESISLTAVSNNMHYISGEPFTLPQKAPMLGAVRVIPREFPHFYCRSIDILLPEQGSKLEAGLMEYLISEMCEPSEELVVAYRGVHRWLPSFSAVSLPEKTPETSRLRHGGVYLITGGLGGIGLTIAKHLAKTVKAKLILLRRSNFPTRDQWSDWLSSHDKEESNSIVIRELMALEDSGSEVMTASADLTNLNQMRLVVAEARRRFGFIHGVIHAAGVFPSGMIVDMTKERIQRVLAPKVQGTIVLNEIFKNAELEFMLLFSSTSTALGNMGYADYCAANAYLDAFAHQQSEAGDTYTVAASWDGWKDVGMAVKTGGKKVEGLDQLISPAEGMEAIDRILSGHRFPQLTVSPFDFLGMLEGIKNHLVRTFGATKKPASPKPQITEAKPQPVPKAAEPAPVAANPQVQPAASAPAPAPAPAENNNDHILNTVLELWKEFLGIYRISPTDGFADLGGDSLMATSMASRLKKIFKVRIPPKDLAEAPTVNGWVETISGILGAGDGAKAAAPPPKAPAPPPAAPEPAAAAPVQQPAQASNTLAVVLDIWQEFLGVSDVTPDSVFSDLGGDSLMATLMASQLKKKFKTRVSPNQLAEHPSAAGWATYIDSLLNPGGTTAAAAPTAAPPPPPPAKEPEPVAQPEAKSEPESVAKKPQTKAAFKAASTETEITLVKLWEEAFGFTDIGVDDHFLELGGHSGLASALVERLKTQFDLDLPAALPIDTPTIAAVAEQIDTLNWAKSSFESGSDIEEDEDEEFEL